MDRKKKSWVAILISDKIDFKTQVIKRDPEGHFIINTQGKNPSRHKHLNILHPTYEHPNIYGKSWKIHERYRQQHTYSRTYLLNKESTRTLWH